MVCGGSFQKTTKNYESREKGNMRGCVGGTVLRS